MQINWNYPTSICVGAGRISELPALCTEFGIGSPLLVTDSGLARLPMVLDMVAATTKYGLTIKIFSQIKSNPSEQNVHDGIAAFQQGKHDGVISVGGGSAIDVGKAIAVLAQQAPHECGIWQIEDVGDNWRNANAARIVPSIAIPTTAGTGSEVGRAALIVHAAEQRKVIIFHPKMLPVCVILDPELTLGLPAELTAATGMDALSHNLEAYCSPLFHPLAEGIALEGMRLIKNHLPAAVADGADLDARLNMLVASTMGATAFQRGLGAMHALAHPLGALYDAHHGTLNAILMPYVLLANRGAIESRIASLANYLELDANFDGFLQWVLALRAQLGIPNDLSQIGIDELRLDEISEMALTDPSATTNPIQFNASTYRKIAMHAVRGILQ